MALIELHHRWNGTVLFALDCDSVKLCLEAAVRSGADLARADLARAKLAGAKLAGAKLRGAYLVDADLAGADLTGADLRGADLTGADLTIADLGDALLAGTFLMGANLRGTDLASIRNDFYAVLSEAPAEVPALIAALESGRVNGSEYSDRQFTLVDNGLLRPWSGLVYCNPPYGKKLEAWLNRMAIHNNGIALIFARTDTRAFFRHVWPKAQSLLFIRGRLTFHMPDGSSPPKGHNSGGPSVLVGYGAEADRRLRDAANIGRYINIS